MKEANILSAYAQAKERYAAIGVDTDKAVAELEKQQISLHCWQTDDVTGFESAGSLTGGMVPGTYLILEKHDNKNSGKYSKAIPNTNG